MDIAHKMGKQKLLTKKYIKNLLSEILYEQTDIRPNNRTVWTEYLKEAFGGHGDFSGVYIHFAFEELEDQIKSDFGIKDEISILFDSNYDLKNNLYWNYFVEDTQTTFKELVNLIYKDFQNELNVPVKDKSYFLNKLKDKLIEPVFGIIYFPLVLFCFVLFVIIFINGPSNAFVELFDLDSIYGDIFGWVLMFVFIYFFFIRNKK